MVMRIAVIAAAICLCVVGISAASDTEAAIRKPINIPAQGLGSALQALAKDRGFQVVYLTDAVDPLGTQGAVGEFTPEEALKTLLHGTGLTYRYLDEKTVTIFPVSALSSHDDSRGASTQPQVEGSGGANSADKEGKKSSSSGFRVAQVDQGQTSSTSGVVRQDENAKQKAVVLEEVVVTGSRIPVKVNSGPQEVKVYTQEQIERSGQSTVADFLNTLPTVSVGVTESGWQTPNGLTSVSLHGMPVGTTLVLLDGRRVEASGSQLSGTYFDLNNIPLAAVERVEVLSEGSSAVYGSDAIAGIVNFILKKRFEGAAADVKYGHAPGVGETLASFALGGALGRGSASVVVSYQTRGELERRDRSTIADEDYRRFGGHDQRGYGCSPGTVFSLDGNPLPGLAASFAAVPVGFVGTPSISEFVATAGTSNKCGNFTNGSALPPTHRAGILGYASYPIATSAEIFTELLFSHVNQLSYGGFNTLFASPPVFYQYIVSATNPYNPFGTTVGVGGALKNTSRYSTLTDTNFLRPLVGASGRFSGQWRWEVTAWLSRDRSSSGEDGLIDGTAIQNALNSTDSATALNPFIDGPIGSRQLIESLGFYRIDDKYVGQNQTISSIVQGTIAALPAGPVKLVAGVEYAKNKLSFDFTNDQFAGEFAKESFERKSFAAFGEGRIPILATPTARQAEALTLTIAARFDHYSDFGNKTTPQLGIEWRPFEPLLIRGSWGRAFKAPSLYNLYQPVTAAPGQIVTDPLRGGALTVVDQAFGGNTRLRPETGTSQSLGAVYRTEAQPDLQVSVSYWHISENDSVQALDPQLIVDNEGLFPGNVIRAPSQNGQPGVITKVIATPINFGAIDVRGFDYQVQYRAAARWGEIVPTLSVTQTEHFSAALLPGLPSTNRVSDASQSSRDGLWAPRWKGTAGIGWTSGPWSTSVTGRYVGRYLDYDGTRTIGNFWLCDLHVSLDFDKLARLSSNRLSHTKLEFGGANILNRLPQFSSFAGGLAGYDPSQGDIRGRFLYAKLAAKW